MFGTVFQSRVVTVNPMFAASGRSESFLNERGPVLRLWQRANLDILLASGAINVLALALPLAILQVYDRIVPNASHATLSLLVIGVGVALLLEALLTLARSRLTAWAGARFEHLAGCAAMDRLLNGNLAKFERIGAGVHLERINALAMLKEFYSGQAALTVADLPFVGLFLALIAVIGGQLVWWPLGIVIGFGLAAIWIGRHLAAAVTTGGTEDERRFNFLLEVLAGVHSVKALGMETLMLRRYERLTESCGRAEYRIQVLSGEAANIALAVAQLTMVAVVAAGSLAVMDGALTIGGLAACSMLASRAVQPIQRALGIWTRFQTIKVAQQRVAELFSLPRDRDPALPPMPVGPGAVSLRGVGFRYDPASPEVLSGIDLDIEPGAAVGITGEAGSGKTTLLWLMMGMLEPTAGRVYLDGRNPRRFDPDSLRPSVAYLAQEAVLFEGTILENIAMFRDGAPMEAALKAAEMVELDAVVGRLPKGFETRVGQGAIEALPRGLTQRIAIARALVDEPRILLFDAANTALDSSGDEVVRRLIERLKGRTTLVLVSVRPSLLRLADRVCELRGGRLETVASGGVPILRPVGG